MSFVDILKIISILLLLLGAMFAILWLMKRFIYKFDTKANNSLGIRVLTTQAILPKKYISLVKFKDKVFLLGISDNAINLIDKVDADELGLDETQTVGNSNFMEILKNSMNIK